MSDEVVEKIDERIEQRKKEINKDLEIDESDLEGEAAAHPLIYHRYVTLFETEKRKLRKIKRALQNKYNSLYKHYRWEGKKKLRNKTEVESEIFTDAKYRKLKKFRDVQKGFVEYLDNVLQILRSRGFAIKQMVDLRKMETNT